VNLSYSKEVAPLKLGTKVEFTYDVKWTKSDIDFEDRFDRYLDDDFFKHKVHWFSIMNSFIMVIFLVALVAIILVRTLNNDYAKYTAEERDEFDLGNSVVDESGWKLVHGDVFRPPPHLHLYCALLGTGTQLVVMSVTLAILAAASELYEHPGGIITYGITSFALSSFVAGYYSGSKYYQYFYPNKSPNWISTMVLSIALYPSIVFITLFSFNWISVYYGTTYAIPFLTMVQVLMIWIFVSFPLGIGGTLLGRHWGARSDTPCRVNRIPREIPSRNLAWYLEPRALILMTGVLPFGSVFIEMYFIFSSFWNYKFYYVYGFMLLVFFFLTIVTICASIVCTYVLLNSENWRWPWVSFLASGSTALYVFLYSVYFYIYKTKMSGFLRTSFYFSHMALFCIAFFILCGTVGNFGSTVFVKRIYRNIKSE